MRLLQSPASSDVGASDGTVLCSCKRLINIHDQPFHCIDCAANQCFFIGRHNAVRDILIAFLRRHRKDALAIPTEPLVTATSTAGDVGVIVTEAAAHQRDLRTAQLQSLSQWRSARMLERNSHKTRADTCIITATGKQYIDVAVENPAAASYLPKPTVDALGFAVRPEAGTSLAVEMRTMEKFRRYCPVLGEDAAQDFDRCVPFIVDATGNCSDVALRLLLEAVGGSKETRATSNVLSKIGGAIARFNAMAAQGWLRRILAARSCA